MRKFEIIILLAVSVLILSACGNQPAPNSGIVSSVSNTNSGSSKETMSEPTGEPSSATSSVEALPEGNYKDTGSGTLIISSPSGTSENGNVPIIYASPDETDSIGISVRGFDGSLLSYVYVDKILVAKEQYGDTDTSICLNGNAMSIGKHEVEVVQYEGNKLDGKVVMFKTALYEIKQR